VSLLRFDARSPFRYEKLWVSIGVAILIAILYFSLERNEKLPRVPGGDKLHHFIAYGILMAWWAQLIVVRRLRLALAFVALGVVIEYLQPIVSNRFFEAMDMVANSVGVAIGWLCMLTPLQHTLAWIDKKLP
jgi:VanZ family protein